MYEHLMNEAQLSLRDEIRQLVRWVPREMILAMDRDELQFPPTFWPRPGAAGCWDCATPSPWAAGG